MNLSTMLLSRAAAGRPVRVGLIGAGKFGSMVLSQAQKIEGLHMVGVADLAVSRARDSMRRVGWPEERYGATSAGDALRSGRTFVTDDVGALLVCEEIDCVIEKGGFDTLAYDKRWGAYRLQISKPDLTEKADLLRQLLRAAYDERMG